MKLIFLDIDGTLTYNGSDVPPASAIEAIRRTRELGNPVFLCTGRNSFLIEPFLKYGFDGVIASAGAYIRLGDEVILDQPIDEERLKHTVDVLHEKGVLVMLETQPANYGDVSVTDFLSGVKEDENSEIARWRRALFENDFMKPMDQYDGKPVYKIVCMLADEEQAEGAMKALQGEYDFALMKAKSGKKARNMELLNPVYSKGAAVKLLARHYGVGIEDTIGFGDSLNDLSMIETVGIGVCMDNGDDELKALSDMVADTPQNDGIYKAFRKLGLLDEEKGDSSWH